MAEIKLNYPKYRTLKWGFSYQLPEEYDWLFGRSVMERISEDLQRNALKHMEQVLQKEVFMNFTDDHTMADWPPSGPTVTPASKARATSRERRHEKLIKELNDAILDAAQRGEFNVSLTYFDEDEARSVASVATHAGYSTSLRRSYLIDCHNLAVSWGPPMRGAAGLGKDGDGISNKGRKIL